MDDRIPLPDAGEERERVLRLSDAPGMATPRE